jgi:toxin-antitoxin system PIN domain toxin
MIVLDVNLLLYAIDTTSPHHFPALKWLEETLSGSEPVGLPWPTAAAFLRISTNATIPGDRFSCEEAAQILDAWLGQPNVRLLAPGERHWPLFRQMITEGQARGPLVSDAQLAALTIEHGGVLHTTDRDFARFPGLRWTNPIAKR